MIKPTSVPTKRLQASITASASSFKLSDILGWSGVALTSADFGTPAYCVFRNANNTQVEFMEFDPATIASASITISKRGLNYTGDVTTESAARKFSWTKGAFVELGSHIPQLYQSLKEYIDAAAIAGAVPATTTVIGITKMSVAPASAASPIVVGDNDPRVANASETALGVVEEATDAEVTAGTATGSTGAKLIVTPAKLATRINALNMMTGMVYNTGSVTKNLADANAATTVFAHGLGVVPTKVDLRTSYLGAADFSYMAHGMWVTGNKKVFYGMIFSEGTTTPVADYALLDSTVAFSMYTDAGTVNGQVATVTVDATNITLTWLKGGSPTGSFDIVWEAEGYTTT